MTLTDAAENDLLLLLFTNIDWANIGDVPGLQNSVVAGSFYISLHTADPGETGNQTTSEATYTGYARQAVARSGAGWTVTADTVDNAAEIAFPEATAGSDTVTHFGIGTAVSGVGNLLMSAVLDASRAISAGITPRFQTGALNVVAA